MSMSENMATQAANVNQPDKYDLIDDISADLGGADRLSEGQRQLIRRAAMLSAESERMEAASVRGEAFDIDSYGALCDRLGRLFQRIGLRRVPRDATTLRAYIGTPAKSPPEIDEPAYAWDGG
jgi:hypothetical protein